MKRRHGYLEPGDVVMIAHREYVAVLNAGQILNHDTTCDGCAFCKANGYRDVDRIHGFKKFHCGGIEDPVENQILLKLKEEEP